MRRVKPLYIGGRLCGRATYKLTWEEMVALYRPTLDQLAVNFPVMAQTLQDEDEHGQLDRKAVRDMIYEIRPDFVILIVMLGVFMLWQVMRASKAQRTRTSIQEDFIVPKDSGKPNSLLGKDRSLRNG